jgi:hypothetical protein
MRDYEIFTDADFEPRRDDDEHARRVARLRDLFTKYLAEQGEVLDSAGDRPDPDDHK